MIDEDVSWRTIALSIRTGKLTARVLAYALRAAGRKIQKERRAHQTPHGRQSVKSSWPTARPQTASSSPGPQRNLTGWPGNGMLTMPFTRPGRTSICCSSRAGRRTQSPLVFRNTPAGCWIRQRTTAYPSGNSSDGPPPRYCASPRPKGKTA
ncbi:hypothetical protein C820_002724 [Clostridium sp. MD294]|nr:hypothetical protein C820_002724 [Clostridium sp. MD294]